MERTHARPERPCGLTRRRRLAKLLLLAVLLAAVFLAGTMFGAVDVSAPDILRILLFGQDSGVYTTIIREVRFPRNLLACMVGACLALSGAIMQGIGRPGGRSVPFVDIANSLLISANGSQADPYLVLADFEEYCRAQREVDRVYSNQDAWNEKAILNVAHSGVFAADRSIQEYNEKIWNLTDLGR